MKGVLEALDNTLDKQTLLLMALCALHLVTIIVYVWPTRPSRREKKLAADLLKVRNTLARPHLPEAGVDRDAWYSMIDEKRHVGMVIDDLINYFGDAAAHTLTIYEDEAQQHVDLTSKHANDPGDFGEGVSTHSKVWR